MSLTDAARVTRTSEAMARRWVSSGRLPVKREPAGINQRTRLSTPMERRNHSDGKSSNTTTSFHRSEKVEKRHNMDKRVNMALLDIRRTLAIFPQTHYPYNLGLFKP